MTSAACVAFALVAIAASAIGVGLTAVSWHGNSVPAQNAGVRAFTSPTLAFYAEWTPTQIGSYAFQFNMTAVPTQISLYQATLKAMGSTGTSISTYETYLVLAAENGTVNCAEHWTGGSTPVKDYGTSTSCTDAATNTVTIYLLHQTAGTTASDGVDGSSSGAILIQLPALPWNGVNYIPPPFGCIIVPGC